MTTTTTNPVGWFMLERPGQQWQAIKTDGTMTCRDHFPYDTAMGYIADATMCPARYVAEAIIAGQVAPVTDADARYVIAAFCPSASDKAKITVRRVLLPATITHERTADGAIVLTGEGAIRKFAAITLHRALRLEIDTGLRMSRRSAYAIVKERYNLRGSKRRVWEQFGAIIAAMPE